ncbi:hypothetical protein EVJ58_g803 [Rhodofomes roseus]|uniref:Copper amine oxidase catalytic domain-containing protein n=1 Tax=Rhodofomes roseus TaxID=34475 RepID=A0A4Y9Z2E4_9APHY|nr:hypothetical protein EVJ58_g803 [Rhodofomes roseus]
MLSSAARRGTGGDIRGYVIHLACNPVHNTVVGSKRLMENANRARYNFALSKRKDTGLSSSNNSLDGEIITQHDLVAWVNVGMHHLPQAEDSPVIRTNLAASSIQHLRHTVENFDADVSMESMNAILLTPPKNPGEPWSFDHNGVENANCVPGPLPPFEYNSLKAFALVLGRYRSMTCAHESDQDTYMASKNLKLDAASPNDDLIMYSVAQAWTREYEVCTCVLDEPIFGAQLTCSLNDFIANQPVADGSYQVLHNSQQ